MEEFQKLGAQFREAREAQALSYEQAERLTRIRARYLEAIEQGDFEFISSHVQLRGFLRNYARTLDLDPDWVVAQFEQALVSAKRRRRRKRRTQENPIESDTRELSKRTTQTTETYQPASYVPRSGEPTITRGGRPIRNILAIVGALVITAAVIGGIVLLLDSITADEDGDEGFSVLDIGSPPPALITTEEVQELPTTTVAPNEPTATQPPPPPKFSGSSLFITITATERAWVRVVSDGNVVFEGILSPGFGVQENAQEIIMLRTSNARGLAVSINDQEVELGETRALVDRTFTVEGLLESLPTIAPTVDPASGQAAAQEASPTPTVPDVISPTPLPTLGPYQTATNTPSRTPIPSPTPNVTATPTPLLPPRETRTPAKGAQ